MADRAHARCDQGGVGERSDAHRHVEPFLNQIYGAVYEKQARGDARECAEELDYDGQHMQSAKYDWRGHGKFTLRLSVLPGETQLCRLELGNDAATGFQIVSTGLCEQPLSTVSRHLAAPRGSSRSPPHYSDYPRDLMPYLNLNGDIQAEWSKDIAGNITKADTNWDRIRGTTVARL